MYEIAYRDGDLAAPTTSFDPRLIGGGRERTVVVGASGSDLAVCEAGEGAGSPLAEMRSANGLVYVKPAQTRDPSFWEAGVPPVWAEDWGRDEFGAWATFTIENVTQRMRWIPPGRFLMESPEDEPRRDADEGPRDEVTIGEGFWLFDTPCAQALWSVVMGDNPSGFKSPDRPVETVSWNDAREFLERINERVPGLSLSLPSEARWEYACRAGTETALYSGEIEILGANNAPALDPIAWYGGNSGIGFELDNGWDSSDWREKQFPHEKAGTHPVGRKRPNAWGLYDMLGNVWEWCADKWHVGYQGAPADGEPWLGSGNAGAARVIRGGSWSAAARDVRSACRDWNPPDDRYGALGFRCARVQS